MNRIEKHNILRIYKFEYFVMHLTFTVVRFDFTILSIVTSGALTVGSYTRVYTYSMVICPVTGVHTTSTGCV